MERNIMRYYLAIITWLDTLKSPAELRFENQISHWYDLTARYKRQLAEAGKEEYLTLKREDKKLRLRIQHDVRNTGVLKSTRGSIYDNQFSQ